jgi:hypothetical protein
VSALVGDKGRCNGRSKSSGDKHAGEEGGQHLGKLRLREMKDDTSCSTCTELLERDLRDLIYVSVRFKTYKDTVCSMIFPD